MRGEKDGKYELFAQVNNILQEEIKDLILNGLFFGVLWPENREDKVVASVGVMGLLLYSSQSQCPLLKINWPLLSKLHNETDHRWKNQ